MGKGPNQPSGSFSFLGKSSKTTGDKLFPFGIGVKNQLSATNRTQNNLQKERSILFRLFLIYFAGVFLFVQLHFRCKNHF
ncbi:MAG TPA: hypothetical protein DIW50_02665 [Prolixibacteraceae bacterium]|nr:hypothetical protein [Prolixibacteraceae bacterium]